MAEKDKKAANQQTKAGLMSKHGDKTADSAAESNEKQTDKSVDENLPRTGKHSTGKSGGREGLH